jgi:O-antigen ligase/tetratricopeptide (TPR) repeat protein
MENFPYIRLLRWGTLGAIFIVPFVSFVVAGSWLVPAMFFPYITGKNFIFRILVEVLFALYMLLALREPKYRPRSSLLMWAMCLFVLWVGISVFFSVDPLKSFWSNFERMEGYITTLHLFVYFIIAGVMLTTEKLWERFFQTSVFASFLQGLVALFQVLHILGFAPSSQSGSRADGTFGNAAYLAVFFLFNFFITLYLLGQLYERRQRPVWLQVFYGLTLVLLLAGLFFTETRGAILGVFGGLIFAGAYLVWQAQTPQLRTARKWALGTLGALVLLTAGFFALKSTPVVQGVPGLARIASISLEDRTTISRFLIWNMAYQGFLERPIVGWGQESFNFVFNKYYDPGMYDQEQWFDRAHNEFLDWLVAAGLPAFLLFISFFALAAWALYRSRELGVLEQAALIGLLVAYAFHSVFVFDNLMSAVYFFTILAFAHGLSRKELPAWMFLSRPTGDKTLAVAAPIAGVVLVVMVYQLNVPGMVRAQTLISAVGTVSPSDLTPNINDFKQALTLGPLGKQETVEQLLQLGSLTGPSTQISPDVKQEVYDLANSAGQELLAERPTDARIELIYASFLSSNGKFNEAFQHLQNALKDSPKKQQILMQLGLTLVENGISQQGLAYLQQAYDEEKRFDDARIAYATGLYFAGQKSQADALLTERFGTVLVDNQQLLTAYAQTKQYDRIIGIWKIRVANSPDDPQTHIGLATAYFVSHDNANAIAELEKAAQISPALAPQINSIIAQIKNGTLKPPQ